MGFTKSLTFALSALLLASEPASVVAHPVVEHAGLQTRGSNSSNGPGNSWDLVVDTSAGKRSFFAVDVFIETNINRGTDGGLYGELIYDRAFQESTNGTGQSNSTALGGGSLTNWSSIANADVSVTGASPLTWALPKSALVAVTEESNSTDVKSRAGIMNGGFFGIAVRPQTYIGSFFARLPAYAKNASLSGHFTVGLYSADLKTTWATADVDASSLTPSGGWQKFNYTLQPKQIAPNVDNVFAISLPAGSAKGTSVQLNLLSLFPPTFKNRPNGLRQDLAQAIADLKPQYIRLPGGNELEGNNISDAYNWTATIGPLEQRPGRPAVWVGWDTEGLGLMDLLNAAEDLGSEALLGVYDGHSLDGSAVPNTAALDPYIQSAVDELHFILDPQGSSEWAKLREQYGRAEPWKLNVVEIGNEDWLFGGPETYGYRYQHFYDALTNAFPNLTYISSSPYNITKNETQAIDQHDYNTVAWFEEAYNHFDSWPRNGTNIYELEFAVINSNATDLYNNAQRFQMPRLDGSISEAVFMLGAERNGDLVHGAAYAPLFQNVNSSQWSPDLVTFNVTSLVKSTSYYVQQLFSEHIVDTVYNVTDTSGKKASPIYWSAGSIGGKQHVLKLANTNATTQSVTFTIHGLSSTSTGTLWTLSGEATASNTLEHPDVVVPVQGSVAVQNGKAQIEVPGYAFVIASFQ